jgi:glycosyltransferase involved in cell wall biosynthesis
MNIVIVGPYPPFRGGISDFNYALADNLNKEHSVNVINFTTQYPKLIFPGKTQYKSQISDYPVAVKRMLSSVNPLTWKKSARYIDELKPDLVIFRFWMPFFALALSNVARHLRKRLNAPFIAICDNIIPHESHLFDAKLTSYFLKRMDKYIVMSKTVEQELLSFIPEAVYNRSPHPIYNIFGDEVPKNTARDILGIKAKKVILFFGLIRKYKGLDILLQSIPLIKEKLNDFVVLIVGECYEDIDKYKNIIYDLNIEPWVDLRVKFLSDKEIAVTFSAADVIALPYRSASQSGIVQVAYHYNKPVVVSDVGGLPEVVEQGKVGFVVKLDPAEFAKALIEILEGDNSEKMSKEVSKYKQQFSWDYFLQSIYELMKR